mmetsp:Transcript_45417/g.108966  ORF Transcript_45417/g.108966 Transcript_45417/m.108966 type:complete len:270 (+) Transcript_45417:125-934(+)
MPSNCQAMPRTSHGSLADVEVATVDARAVIVAALEDGLVEHVAHPLHLRAQVLDVVRVGYCLGGDALCDAQPVAREPRELLGVVGHEAHVADAQGHEDLRARAILARVDRQAQLGVGVERVRAALLQRVGVHLGAQPDAAPLLPAQVEHDTVAVVLDCLQRGLELRPAVASQAAEDVAGAALRVHAHERGARREREGRLVSRVVGRLDERDVLDAVDEALEAVRHEEAVLGRHLRWQAAPLDERLVAAHVRHDVRRRGEGDARLGGELS